MSSPDPQVARKPLGLAIVASCAAPAVAALLSDGPGSRRPVAAGPLFRSVKAAERGLGGHVNTVAGGSGEAGAVL